MNQVPRAAGKRCAAFTLVELLVSIAIIAVMAATLYTSLAPARERASETRCISNLRQIGLALQMYRQDYHGGDPPAALTPVQLGLPYSISYLWRHAKDQRIFKCNSEYWGNRPEVPISYQDALIDAENPPAAHVPKFSQIVARQGEDTVVLTDPHHGTMLRPVEPRPKTTSVLVLRLSGQVQRLQVPSRGNYWEMEGRWEK